MSQAKKKQIVGQLKAIKQHEAKKAAYPDPRDKAFAQKTINNATNRLSKLRNK